MAGASRRVLDGLVNRVENGPNGLEISVKINRTAGVSPPKALSSVGGRDTGQEARQGTNLRPDWLIRGRHLTLLHHQKHPKTQKKTSST